VPLVERAAQHVQEIEIVEDASLAAVDVGSNTIHLVVARPTEDGSDLITLADELDLTRLGEDVSATGSIGPERTARAITVLREQAARARALGATDLLAIATEGVRAAANADEFLARVHEETGITLHLVTGDQEAALTYWGATSGLPATTERRAVLDLGGGSMEVVIGEGSRIHWRSSLPLGSGAMHARYAPSDPPRAAELDQVRRVTLAQLVALNVPLPVAQVIACGGTATTLAMLAARALHIPEPEDLAAGEAAAPLKSDGVPNADGMHLGLLSSDHLEAIASLLNATPAEQLTQLYGIPVKRAQLLGAGEAVLRATVEHLGTAALSVSRRGVREGAILARQHAGDAWLDAATAAVGWKDEEE
jgi:exopolyphosphatase/guanosine-5'-triphosphate,3'-diphosphate pyrophosphatase